MKTSLSGQLFIKSFESLSLACYDDNGGLKGGFATVGWGHLIKDGEGVLMNGITHEQAEQLFLMDLEDAEIIVNNSFAVFLNQNQYDSLVSFAFNTGRMSTTLKGLINNGFPEIEIRNFWTNHYITSAGVQLNGLIRRRKAECNLYFKLQNAIT